MDKGAVPKRMGELEDGSAVRSLGSDLQTAFWHSTTTASTTAGAGAGAAGAATKKGVKSSPAPKKGGGGSGYTFLVLNDTDSDSDSDEEKGGMGLSASSSRVRGGKGEDGTIMLSGGLMGGTFEGVIEEDYVDSTLVELERTRRQAGVSYDRSSGSGRGALADGTTNAAGGKMYSTQSPLTEGLLGGGDGDEGEFDEETVQFTGSGAFTAAQPTGTSQGQPTRQGEATPLARGEEGGAGSSSSNTHLSAADDEAPNSFPPQRQAATIKEALYWQERYLQNRIRKFEASDFWALPLPQKVLTALEFPVDFVRDVTIPTLQQESWYRPYAIFHPIAIGIVYEYTFRDFEAGSVFLTVLLACVPATYIFLTTHRSKPPSQSSVLETLWVLTAFLMCIVWFYLLCGELICILESMGRIMNIPSAYLGLTLLAWGNCVGDFFSIMALAKRGLGEMAIAGCYASPIFDMLVGLGLSTTLATTKIYPEPFVLEFDRSSYVSILFLYFTLGASLLLISRRGWRLEKNFGYFLYSVYGVYTFVQISHIW
jgi:Ca2+/Na+ antiporter